MPISCYGRLSASRQVNPQPLEKTFIEHMINRLIAALFIAFITITSAFFLSLR
jgi:hypothetical protein